MSRRIAPGVKTLPVLPISISKLIKIHYRVDGEGKIPLSKDEPIKEG